MQNWPSSISVLGRNLVRVLFVTSLEALIEGQLVKGYFFACGQLRMISKIALKRYKR